MIKQIVRVLASLKRSHIQIKLYCNVRQNVSELDFAILLDGGL